MTSPVETDSPPRRISSIITPRTALGETRQVRGILFATAIVTSLLWGCASAGAVMAAGGAIGHAAHWRDPFYDLIRFAAAVTGLSVATIRIWRRRYAYSIRRVGLWLEERLPSLDYTLVTVLDPDARVDPTILYRLEKQIRDVNLPEVALRAAVPAYVRVALTVLVVAFLLARVMPLSPSDTGVVSAATPSTTVTPANVFAGFRAHVTPPVYAHERAVDITEPTAITALVGSTITLQRRDGWTQTLPMPREATALTLTAGAAHRVVALLPIPDAPPIVVLSLPVADTTYRTAPKTMVLEAKATDDIGLADGWFECIISTGESEGNYKSVTDTIGRIQFSDTKTGVLRAVFSRALEPGSQLSIRAISRDGNTVTGPGVGSSDTRTIRIASAKEYDSLSLAAAAPPILDKALMSQRMLVMQLEALVAKRKRPKSESVRLAAVEEGLRQEVDDILNGGATSDSAGEPGEREDVDVAKGGGGAATSSRERQYFQVAYQAMTDAARSLGVAMPDTALPPARRALSALDSARVMNRLYLRGTPPTIVVNTARVRLAGPPGGPTSDTAAPAHRTPSPRADSLRATVLRYVEAASPQSDSLSLLQVAVAPTDTALARALGEAAAARDTTHRRSALLRVRRAAMSPPRMTSGLAP